MRLCFIRDSHLGAIKNAWDSTHADATFFALPGKGIARLEVRNGSLSSDVPEICRYFMFVSGGLDHIDGAYDAYALHAMYLGIADALAALRTMRGPPLALVGTQELRAALRAAIENSIAMTTLRKLRQISDAPAVVSPTPLADSQFPAIRKRLTELNLASQIASLFTEECNAACESLGAKFVPQPPETLAADGLATRAEYAKGAARFSARAAEGDIMHMNAQYGAAVIEKLMAAL